jgi:hypothetical protein
MIVDSLSVDSLLYCAAAVIEHGREEQHQDKQEFIIYLYLFYHLRFIFKACKVGMHNNIVLIII